jgi:uncharacterized membrane protein YebE (DUF533 family)
MVKKKPEATEGPGVEEMRPEPADRTDEQLVAAMVDAACSDGSTFKRIGAEQRARELLAMLRAVDLI